jgi:hypothetical protein
MDPTVIALLLVVGCLPLVLVTHVVVCRAGARSGRPAQGSAATAAFLATLCCTALAGLGTWGRPEFGPTVLYTGLACACLGYVYFVMFCNTESGRRYHVVRLLHAGGGMEEGELRALYSPRYMIEKRLERLLQWNVLGLEGDRLVIRKKGSLGVAYIFFAWSRVLGFGWGR